MPNPKPDLQGWADRDEDPQWMENAIARVRARQKQSKTSQTRNNGTYIFYDAPFRVLLNEAAHRRGGMPEMGRLLSSGSGKIARSCTRGRRIPVLSSGTAGHSYCSVGWRDRCSPFVAVLRTAGRTGPR